MIALPTGWASISLSELVLLKTGPFGSTLHQSDYVQGGIPLVNPMHIAAGRIVASAKSCVSLDTAERLSDFRFRLRDIVLGRRGEMGRCAIVSAREVGWLCGTGSLIVRPNHSAINADFLQRFIASDAVVQYLLSASVGSTMANLNQEHLLGLSVNLPPVAEQTRIVEKLEELFSDLDAGVAELKAAQKKLAQYRQSLRKAAVEGALTAEWRTRNTPLETGAQLLEHILTERRARWEAKQTLKFKEQGKTPPKDWQKKYPEPGSLNDKPRATLPAGWTWASVDQLSPDDLTNGRSVPSAESGAKVLRLTAVRNGRIDLSASKHGAWTEEEAKPFAVFEGDLLIVRGNGSLPLVGRAALVPKVQEQVAYPDTLIRLRVVESVVRPAWLGLMWDSKTTRTHLERRARTSAGIYKISQPDIVSVAIPVPPLEEQDEILEAFATSGQSVVEVELMIGIGLKQSTAQRQNILCAAFAGQLVPQDPKDEPASVLLTRIRAGRPARAMPRISRAAAQ